MEEAILEVARSIKELTIVVAFIGAALWLLFLIKK